MQVWEMIVKNRLQQWLDEMELNYSQAAKKTGVHVSTIRRIAKQSDRLDVNSIRSICMGLGKKPDNFLYGEPEKDEEGARVAE